MDQKKIGSFIKTLRKEKGLTQEQLSEKLGVTNRSVSRWENGVNMPDFDLIIELSDLYGVSIDEILCGERRTEMKEENKSLLKVAEYENEEKMAFSKRLRRVFTAGFIFMTVFMVIDILGLSEAGIYRNIADLSLGIVFGALITGIIFTSRYASKIRAFKMRLLKRGH